MNVYLAEAAVGTSIPPVPQSTNFHAVADISHGYRKRLLVFIRDLLAARTFEIDEHLHSFRVAKRELTQELLIISEIREAVLLRIARQRQTLKTGETKIVNEPPSGRTV